jgi:hypothetical protein
MPLAAALNGPLPHGFSPVRPWRAGLPLALLRFSPPHKSPPPGTAHRAETLVVCSSNTSVVWQRRGRVCVGSDIVRR